MNFKITYLITIIFLLTGCSEYNKDKKNLDFKFDKKYKNSGFTLVYNDKQKKQKIISKKLDFRSLKIFHKSLKKDSFVKITNPANQKTTIAEVASNNVKFPHFYNSVISPRIAEILELDPSEPYVELILISQNSTFIAKKAKMFDEEKKVAEKAPIDGIEINDLNTSISDDVKKINKFFSYSIKIADFYYHDSAQTMINRINKETLLKKLKIKKLSKTKFRVLLGPYNDIETLNESFNKIISLNFENLEILKNV